MSAPIVRKAAPTDEPAILQLDAVAREDARRVAFVRRVIDAGQAYVATTPQGAVTGYAALDYSFYDQGFVSMLYVALDHRRKGAATALMVHLESLCETPKIFTSTNQSNTPMQRLLSKLAYSPSGVIENLDPGDPELVYVKFIRRDFAAA